MKVAGLRFGCGPIIRRRIQIRETAADERSQGVRLTHEKCLPVKRRCHSRRGVSLILIAVCLIPLLGMLGLAMDAGRVFIVRTELQSFVDASAMAAIGKLDGTRGGVQAANPVALAGPLSATVPNTYNFGTAAVAGVTTAYATSFNGTYDTFAAASGPATNGYWFIRVAASAQVPLYFLPVIPGIAAQAPLSVTAIAGQRPRDGPVRRGCAQRSGDQEFRPHAGPGLYAQMGEREYHELRRRFRV